LEFLLYRSVIGKEYGDASFVFGLVEQVDNGCVRQLVFGDDANHGRHIDGMIPLSRYLGIPPMSSSHGLKEGLVKEFGRFVCACYDLFPRNPFGNE
jgi:hypothetical protein